MGDNVRRTPKDVKPRRRRPRGSLSQDAILDAAEALAVKGFGAITMRGVATELDAVPMALYNHFATKDDLVDGLLNRVLGRFAPPLETDDWLADLRAFACAHRLVLDRHPWAVTALFTQPTPGLGAVRIGECALRILRHGGLRDGDAVAAFSGIIALNYGWASFTTARDHDPAGRGDQVPAALAMLPAEVFPLTAAVAAEMGAYGSDAHYAFVLDRLLAGLGAATGG